MKRRADVMINMARYLDVFGLRRTKAVKRLSVKLGAAREDEWQWETAHRQEFIRRAFKALSFNGITGDYAEFGCASGNTFRMAYQESRCYGYGCRLWAFDSFRGLPPTRGPADAHPQWQEGAMAMSVDKFKRTCQAHGIPDSDYTIVPGYYEDTIGKSDLSGSNFPDEISLAYVDCDLYSSTKTVLDFLGRRLKNGMIIAFDDYFCISSTALAGERAAFLEMQQTHPAFHFLPFVQFGWTGMSFIVEDASLLRAG